MGKLLCIKCQKEVADYNKIKGITTWFAVCSECLYGVAGWTEEDMKNSSLNLNNTKGQNDK